MLAARNPGCDISGKALEVGDLAGRAAAQMSEQTAFV
jgi:hypothetical protein